MSYSSVGAIKHLIEGAIYSDYATSRFNQGVSLFVPMVWDVMTRADLSSTKNVRVVLPADNAATVTAVESGAVDLIGIVIDNDNASTSYVQLFNVAGASVTLGTTVPFTSIPVAGDTMRAVVFAEPLPFGTAFSWDASTTLTGATRTTAADVKVMLVYAE